LGGMLLMPKLRPSRLEGTGPKAIIGLIILFISLYSRIYKMLCKIL
jgi:putative effector of murein hydrolase LrgA (UPF0299 family)